MKPKIKLWDLECSDLSANWGVVLCGGIKTYGRPGVKVPVSHNPVNDRDVIVAIAREVSDADAWITWYGSRFDVPFLNSRLIFHGLDPLPPIPHIDGWKIAKYKLKLNSNRLASVQDFLGLETEKTKVSGPTWLRAISGDKKAMAYIVEHCRRDVEVLEEAYDRIKALQTTPVLNLALSEGIDGCPICGAEAKRLVAHGYGFTNASRYRRYQCTSCGAWKRGRLERIS